MRKYPHSLPYDFEFLDHYTIRKHAVLSSNNNRHFIQVLCEHLIANPDPMVVPILDFKLGSNISGYHYHYDMEMMLMLHTDEKRLVNQSFNKYEMLGELPSQSSDEIIQQGWNDWPDLMRFMERWILLGRHLDIHDGNVMIDTEDQYKLVDLEGFISYGLDSPLNDWIIR